MTIPETLLSCSLFAPENFNPESRTWWPRKEVAGLLRVELAWFGEAIRYPLGTASTKYWTAFQDVEGDGTEWRSFESLTIQKESAGQYIVRSPTQTRAVIRLAKSSRAHVKRSAMPSTQATICLKPARTNSCEHLTTVDESHSVHCRGTERLAHHSIGRALVFKSFHYK